MLFSCVSTFQLKLKLKQNGSKQLYFLGSNVSRKRPTRLFCLPLPTPNKDAQLNLPFFPIFKWDYFDDSLLLFPHDYNKLIGANCETKCSECGTILKCFLAHIAAEEREDEEQTSRGQSGYREHKVTFSQIYDLLITTFFVLIMTLIVRICILIQYLPKINKKSNIEGITNFHRQFEEKKDNQLSFRNNVAIF